MSGDLKTTVSKSAVEPFDDELGRPVIEPLMGWTGGDDTLIQVKLTFPTREAAVAYAERQGLTFVIEGHDGAARAPDCRATNKPCVAQEHSSQRTLPANLSLARMQARRDPCNLSKSRGEGRRAA
jgi:hypothetical protein